MTNQATGNATQYIPVPVPRQDKLGGLWHEWHLVIKLGDDGMEVLETQMSWHTVGSSAQVPPRILLCSNQIQKNVFFLVPAHLGHPG